MFPQFAMNYFPNKFIVYIKLFCNVSLFVSVRKHLPDFNNFVGCEYRMNMVFTKHHCTMLEFIKVIVGFLYPIEGFQESSWSGYRHYDTLPFLVVVDP